MQMVLYCEQAPVSEEFHNVSSLHVYIKIPNVMKWN